MDQAIAERIAVHLREQWKGRPCPMCGRGPWNLHPEFVNLITSDTPDRVNLAGKQSMLPSAAVICGGCGYTVLVNLLIVGIVQADPNV